MTSSFKGVSTRAAGLQKIGNVLSHGWKRLVHSVSWSVYSFVVSYFGLHIQVVTIRNLPRDVIDISVQIFDKYLAQSMKDFPEVVFGGVSIPMTAACCLLIGSKVSAGRTSVSMVWLLLSLFWNNLMIVVVMSVQRKAFRSTPKIRWSCMRCWFSNASTFRFYQVLFQACSFLGCSIFQMTMPTILKLN